MQRAAPTSTPSGRDFASEVLADPWDYADSADVLTDNGPTAGLQSPRVSGGLFSFTMSSPGYFSPLWDGYPGALDLDRDGAAGQQIDADTFTQLSFAAYASAPTAAGVMWFTCEGLSAACEGGQPIQLQAGWHTYDVQLVNSAGYGLPRAWAGSVTGLRLALSPQSSTSFAFDWVRVYQPGTSAATAPAGTTGYDLDGDTGNNTSARPGWGELSCQRGCDLSMLPAGDYRLLPSGERVRLMTRARPVVLDPDAVGGPEVAAADPWDFNAPGDVASTGNTTVVGYGPRLTARNAGPVINDPFVWLRLPTPVIDPQRYHRLTVTSGYSGPFNLADTAGGGTHARVIWQGADEPKGTVEQTKEWVTYSGTRTTTYDLASPNTLEDDRSTTHTWGTAPVTGLRWDPNEDRAARQWTLDRVALRADDEAGSRFLIRWADAGYVPGATADLYYDTDGTGYHGTLIARGIPETAGASSYAWNTTAVPAGSYHVYVVVHGDAGTGFGYSTGPVRIDHTIIGTPATPAPPLTRDLLAGCPQDVVPPSGLDDTASTVHAGAIDCVVWWQVARGTGSGFSPAASVTRGQMATFLARVLQAAGTLPPGSGTTGFSDTADSVHAANIRRLATAGVIGGYPDGTYRPHQPVSRAQMAAFLTRTATAAGVPLPAGPDAFADDQGGSQEAATNAAAAAGLVSGTGVERYDPAGPVRRDQMASFLARLLDLLAAERVVAPPGH